VALRDDWNLCAPRLRRYARALIGGHPAPHEIADDLVQAILPRALEDGAAIHLAGPELHLHLYTLITEAHRERRGINAQMGTENFTAGGPRAAPKPPLSAHPRDRLAEALLSLALEEREALLLVVLEGFSHAQAARILKISRTVLVARLARARAALGEIPAAKSASHPTKGLPPYLRVVK
jgi:RNA polymerase sigma-70 factor, ECF subfamily